MTDRRRRAHRWLLIGSVTALAIGIAQKIWLPELPDSAAAALRRFVHIPAETNATGQDAEDAVAFRPGMTMQEIERAAIIATLKDVGGNRRRASEKLEIGERTLYRKIKEYDIDA